MFKKGKTTPTQQEHKKGSEFSILPWFVVLLVTIGIGINFLSGTQNIDTNLVTEEFVIQPKIGETFLGAENIVMQEGESFVLDLSESIVPNPPAIYLYDNDGDGIAETPFENGDRAMFVMRKTSPPFTVCELTENGETCSSKIVGIDSAGNKVEYIFYSTTIYKN